jgi:hypothetical protein
MATNRLFAGSADRLFYSDDGGNNWTDISPTVPPFLFAYVGGFWGPQNKSKLYLCSDSGGIYAWEDGVGWTEELADASAYGGGWWSAGFISNTWCSADDTLVCAVGLGTGYYALDQIRTRPGPPGTAWVTEYDRGTPGNLIDVNGTPDGSSVFAVEVDSSVGTYGTYNILKRNVGGTWSVVHSFAKTGNYDPSIRHIRVTSPTEVRLFGNDGTAYIVKVWLWNGATLTEEFSFDLRTITAWRLDSTVGWIWMSEDGQDGGMAFSCYGCGVYFRKTGGGPWVMEQEVYSHWIITACAGMQAAVDDRIMLAQGYFIRRTGGGIWPGTPAVPVDPGEPIDAWGATGWLMGYFPFEVSSDTDPPVLQNQDPAPSSTGNARDVEIALEIVDVGSGVDAASVVLKVKGVTAWTGDAQQPGFSVTKSVIADGFRYVIERDALFDYADNVVVGVYAADLAGTPNVLDTTYDFDIVLSPPYVVPVDPVDGETGVDFESNARLRLFIPTALQEPWRIRISRGYGWETVLTFSGGSAVFEPGFDGPGSETTYFPAGTFGPTHPHEGYEIVVDPVLPFFYWTAVKVGIAVRDTSGRAAEIDS